MTQMVKHLSANAGDTSSVLGSGRFPGEDGNPHPIFLPGQSHGQRSLEGYSPLGPKRMGHEFSTKHQQSMQKQFVESYYLSPRMCLLLVIA